MVEYSLLRRIWRAVYPMLIIAAMHNFLSLITSVVTTAIYTSSNRGSVMDVEGYVAYLSPLIDKIGVLLGILGYVLCLVIFLPMWIKMRKRLPSYVQSGNPAKTAFILAVMFICLSLVQSTIIRSAGLTEHFALPESSASLTIGSVFLIFVAVVVVGPIAREICFRGIIQNRLLTWAGVGLSLVLQAVICGFAPFDVVKGVFDFALGLALGYIYLRHRSVLLCIVAHMSFALPGFITRINPSSITDTQSIAILTLGAIMSAIGCYFLLKQPATVIAEPAYDTALPEPYAAGSATSAVSGSVAAKDISHSGKEQRMVQKHSIPRQIWRAISPMLITIAIPFLVGSVMGVVLSVKHITSNSGTSLDAAAFSDEFSHWIIQYQMLLTLISTALCLLPFLNMWSKTRKQLPLYTPIGNLKSSIVYLAMAFAGFNIMISYLVSVTGLSERFSYSEISDALLSGDVLVRALTVLVFAPIVEEICFRGIIQNRLLTWTKSGIAIFAQALIFGFAHFNIVQGIYTFILGIALGLVYLRFRSLWLCITAHMAFNLPGFVIGLFNGSQYDIPVLVIIISGIVLAAIGGFLIHKQPASVPIAESPPGSDCNEVATYS